MYNLYAIKNPEIFPASPFDLVLGQETTAAFSSPSPA